jgi:hypothetical protein
MFPQPIRLLPLTLLSVIIFAGCSDGTPTVTEQVAPPTSRPAFAVSPHEAFSIADQYDERQPLAPFGVSVWDFNDNPELVTDDQFTQHGEATLTEWEVYQIEADASQLEDHVNNCSGYHSSGGGSPDPFLSTTNSYDRCDDLLRECFKRCKRIRNLKGRGACYTACFAAYVFCRANV